MTNNSEPFYILYRIDESFDESMFNCCLFRATRILNAK
jgi:hypothetical protein